ncbi:33 kda dynein arm light axonemal [Cyclospora cayetanensis]|uniref:33 kDa dynein arm light axonemal n=1 Tax=Cyclospora cayetanensis TaxID=88456 RepID=A0A1D3D0M8_9EIME|nr:33 kda dynein arm light axonemal [Cyclospora cayetanensis]
MTLAMTIPWGGCTQVRYGPPVEVPSDSTEVTAALANGSHEDNRDTVGFIERIRREAQGSRVPLQAILDTLFPPRHVSAAAADRVDVLKTREELDVQLLERRASETGVCACRYDAILQCFDELIRQVAILCPERAFLLIRQMTDEINAIKKQHANEIELMRQQMATLEMIFISTHNARGKVTTTSQIPAQVPS